MSVEVDGLHLELRNLAVGRVRVTALTSPIRARFRRIAVIGALVGLVLAALVAAAPLVISGHRLGRVVGWMLPSWWLSWTVTKSGNGFQVSGVCVFCGWGGQVIAPEAQSGCVPLVT